MPRTKHCPRCKRDLPRGDFGKHATRADGLTAYCRSCTRARYEEKRDAELGKDRRRRGRRCSTCDQRKGKADFPKRGGVCYACTAGQQRMRYQRGPSSLRAVNAALAIANRETGTTAVLKTNGHGAAGALAALSDTGLSPLIARVASAMRAGGVSRLVVDVATEKFEIVWTRSEAGELPAEETN